MIKKMLTILVILSFLSISTAYAYDPGDDHRNDQTAGIALVAVLTVVTAVILLASHDRHGEQRPAPRHLSRDPYDSRDNDNYRPRDYRDNDNDKYDHRYQENGPGQGNWKKWERR